MSSITIEYCLNTFFVYIGVSLVKGKEDEENNDLNKGAKLACPNVEPGGVVKSLLYN